MNTLSNPLHYILRSACAMCFIGHGAFGIVTKQIWCNYFGVFGIEESLAYQLMPWVGLFDITFGILIIIYPMRLAAYWLMFWGLFTALLRPLAGESFGELLERAGNFGAPFLLILFSDDRSMKNQFARIRPASTLSDDHVRKFCKAIQAFASLLLVGHGWLNVIGKAGLLKQYASLGFQHPEIVAQIIGVMEITAALIILVKPLPQIILILFIWKMASELFYPSYEVLEWVERGGSYGILLALWLVLKYQRYHPTTSEPMLTADGELEFVQN